VDNNNYGRGISKRQNQVDNRKPPSGDVVSERIHAITELLYVIDIREIALKIMDFFFQPKSSR